MPLKEVDLKTFESYKKAVHSDVTKITDSSKTKFWVYKDIELPDAKGKKQKILGFIVLVDDAHVRGAMRGKKLLCNGICNLESGKVNFEPIKGKVPYARLKKSVPLFLGKQLFVPKGANEDEDDDPDEIEDEETSSTSQGQPTPTTQVVTPPPQAPPPQAPPPPPPLLDPAVVANWQKLEPQIKQAIAANPARKDALAHAAQAIVEALKAHNGAEATKLMDAMKTLLATPSTPPVDASALKAEWAKLGPRINASGDQAIKQAAAEAGKQLGALVSQGKLADAQAIIDRLTAQLDKAGKAPEPKVTSLDIVDEWKRLAALVEKKAKINPQAKAEANKAGKQAQDLAKAGKFQEAKKVLDELEVYLKGITEEEKERETESEEQGKTQTKVGKDPDDEEEEEEEEEEEAADPRKKQYEQEWKELEPEVQLALKARRGDVSRMRAAVALAGERAEGLDYASALKVLNGLRELVEEAEDLEEGSVPGLVEYRKKLLAFQGARRKVEQQLEKLSAAIPKEVPDEADLADALAEEISEELEEVQEVIDAAINAANDDRAPANAEIKKRVAQTLKTLDAHPLIAQVESNPFGIAVEIRKTLMPVLEQIADAMPVA